MTHLLAPLAGGVEAAADYPWEDAFAWAETVFRDRQENLFMLARISWAATYSPLAAQGVKDLPECPRPPHWME